MTRQEGINRLLHGLSEEDPEDLGESGEVSSNFSSGCMEQEQGCRRKWT